MKAKTYKLNQTAQNKLLKELKDHQEIYNWKLTKKGKIFIHNWEVLSVKGVECIRLKPQTYLLENIQGERLAVEDMLNYKDLKEEIIKC